MAADYTFYKSVYLGVSIAEEDFLRLARRAQEQLARYQRMYTVSVPEGSESAEEYAVCAIADALYYYEQAACGALVTSVSVGSVSSSVAGAALPDTSPKAQAAELYRCARQYLNIYRGGGRVC